jgi:hypothetical protein
MKLNLFRLNCASICQYQTYRLPLLHSGNRLRVAALGISLYKNLKESLKCIKYALKRIAC